VNPWVKRQTPEPAALAPMLDNPVPAINPFARLRRLLDGSVKAKLLLLALAPVLLGFPLVTGLVWYWSNTSYQQLLSFKVASDLVTAHEYLDQLVRTAGANVAALTEAHRLRDAIRRHDDAALLDELQRAKKRYGLDFIHLLDRNGRVVDAAVKRGSVVTAWDAGGWPVVRDAIAGKPGSAIDVFAPELLAAISPSLATRATTSLVPTPLAVPDARSAESRGMVIHAAAPVLDDDGRVLMLIEGGMLLNGNLGFVDTINAIVYRDGSLPLGSKGTATLFLGDTRIATNVRLFADERALGTRVSRMVREYVLENGGTWLDTAFVVNDYYVSGYEPVYDSLGKRVGMLYVGFLEAPFRSAKETALLIIVTIFAAISLIGCTVSLRWAQRIMRPVALMNRTIVCIEEGDVAARVGETGSIDELGRFAAEFDHLLDVLAQKRNELQRWADELDAKVVERTRELEVANAELRQAQRQLVTSEKLAAIGELTAGVAHEINNPIAVIQGNLDVLRETLGPQIEPVMQEVRLIDEQVHRIRVIVTKLLQFARPGEFAGYVESLDAGAILADCLVLAQHHLGKRSIAVVQNYRASGWVSINRHELQQVLINLVVNAIQAMPDGGTLTLGTEDWLKDGVTEGVRISVRDTGAGIAPADISRIFDPFFTTKKHEGTGLGLSISHSLIKRYGGSITVDSVVGAGTEFSVWLLSEPLYEGDGDSGSPARPAHY